MFNSRLDIGNTFNLQIKDGTKRRRLALTYFKKLYNLGVLAISAVFNLFLTLPGMGTSEVLASECSDGSSG